MSEFKEERRVSLLKGSPPGYVGYGEGGVLTEAVHQRPIR
jgi:type VI secretion system protein VasG